MFSTKIKNLILPLSVLTLIFYGFVVIFGPSQASAVVLYPGPDCGNIENGRFPLVAPYVYQENTYRCARNIKEGDGFPADANGGCLFGLPSIDTGAFGRICFHGDKITYDKSKLLEEKSDCKTQPLDRSNCQIVNYLFVIINVLSALVGVIVVAMIIYGGIQYSSAGDDPQKIAEAKKKIINALLALFIYFFMFAFLQWIVPGGIF